MNNDLTAFEKIPVKIFKGSEDASAFVAKEIADLIKKRASDGKHVVLGLATGSTPTRVYAELVRMHKKEGLSFKNVFTFNLDEYFPMPPDSLQSYVRFMNEHLFNHIDIPKQNVHIPDGTLPKEQVAEYCRNYEKKIDDLGGIDIQVLGIGRTGHIGFNEPGSTEKSFTRLVTLDQVTRIDAASDFFGEENVPRKAITMGVGTILKAKRTIMMAWGEGKARVIKKAVEGPITDQIPSSFLQKHDNCLVVLDEAASSELVRIKTPWVLDSIDWNETLIRKAVVWLCQTIQKPVLKLTNHDYMEHGMGDIITEYGSAYQVNIKVFNFLQHTITGWPGGKPNADDTHRPERATPFPKKVIIFSPHPDDDVISMGGTFIRLVDQGHEVHVAYQTSGNIAVFDDDAVRFADFVRDFNSQFGLSKDDGEKFYKQVVDSIKKKGPGQNDSPEVMAIKGLIRRGEAKAGGRYVGIPDEQMHFMNMPFYETGAVKKKPLGEDDIQITMDLIKKIQPHQIYAAGDLSDPHGTHRVCLAAVMEACRRLKNEPFMKDCWVWLYRGAWQEWDIDQIEMAVPLSPEELMRKRRAVFKHQSQKDSAMFPGSDKREFWMRAEDRNHATAEAYNMLGLAEYEAMEAFVRWHY
ncbi:glucosamine-6-phosphate deaminase [Pseudochryseolinea flava]|uniref:Glucosamine-6-phosphate deaminase n=1 Tax=Pseudochryseolinea flava TaxID=2059302 RepID=A0A364Y0Y7_9BACT|nr:glucosamine-6-phosphate deaminase [Pseudochryseolinea flava]RAV99597.1 glucosamine-6-phosphate deaminase [Pseudochryseolinea flava]